MMNKENDDDDDRTCKRRIDFNPGKRASVARRNERERNRVKLVNLGFATLRDHVPNGGKSKKKMSKVDTLRSAADYIKYLKDLLDGQNPTTALKGVDNSSRVKSVRTDFDVASTGYASDCSSDQHSGEDLLEFSNWFQ